MVEEREMKKGKGGIGFVAIGKSEKRKEEKGN
jgi:hypothetical protein